MANENSTITVETGAHEMLRSLAEEMWKLHGLRIDEVRFSWINVSSVSGSYFVLDDVEMKSATKWPGNDDGKLPVTDK